MATRTLTIRTCDFKIRGGRICGADAEAPGFIATIASEKVKGDLCTAHQTALSDELVKLGMTSVGMRTAGRKVTKGLRGKSGKKFSTAEARAWAIESGLFEPGRKGRLPKDVVDQYAAAH